MMKLLAIAAATGVVILAGTVNRASAHVPTPGAATFSLRLPLGMARSGVMAPRSITFQTGSTATATPTATGTPGSATPTPTATASPTPTAQPTPAYPDPVSILQNFAQVYSGIRSAHVELVTSAAKAPPTTEKLTIDGKGDANCSGPSLQLKVTGTDKVIASGKTTKATATFVQVKNKTELKLSGKKATWKKVKDPGNVAVFGFPYPIENPLACPSLVSGGNGGSSGGYSDVTKDVVNLGPDTYKGNAVWHIRFTDVRTDPTGTSIDLIDDFLIGQAKFLPYVLQQTFNDTQDGLIIVQKQVTTKVGEKVKITYHKLGSK